MSTKIPNSPSLKAADPADSDRGFFFSRSFFALFWVQFLGAFNDNLFKNAMVMLIAFQLSRSGEETGLYITLAAGLFILPFFLFSSLAGQLADHFPKTVLIRKIKLAEILIMFSGAIGLLSLQMEWLYASLFLMGVQSAFFGPIKYSILPEVLCEQQLQRGNSWFSGSTFIAILLGTLVGGLVVSLENGTQWMALAVVLTAFLGYLASLKVPHTMSQSQALRIDRNIFRSTVQMIRCGRSYKQAFFAVLAISWFWFIGAVLLSQIPAFVKYTLVADESVVVAFLTLFSVGIALGAGLVAKLFGSKVELSLHPLMLLLMTLLLLLSVWVADRFAQDALHIMQAGSLIGLSEFIGQWPQNLSLLFLFALAVIGGAYIVPLYTHLQLQTPAESRARMVAVNNILNALLMAVSSLLIMLGYLFDLSLPTMLVVMAIMNLFVAAGFYRYQGKPTVE
ncbi:MFS transporter [Thiomicrorhabdus sp. zzn3]|uniref:MFS transporter n=1 Tax=Thiomicrorhabdus sp. zzn3 TaxID=3039775 RepID=UPI002436A5F6|nr:MFS transporter [Thiomicrorhabdus sp. zzn3]MDG6778789.1 MFS transporter [Thiomicrorhabdus sp. zzn3]